MTDASSYRIAVLDDFQGVSLASADWSVLPGDCHVDVSRKPLRGAELVDFLRGAHVAVAMRERTALDRVLLAALPTLKLIVTTGMRNAAIDLRAARDHGILVCGTGSLAGPATELTWALVMACMRRLPDELASMSAGRWQTTIGTELEGRTIGVLGLGHIGRRIARIARVFDMDVIAWSERLTTENASAAGAELVAPEDLYARADVVTVHLRLSDRTRGLIGERELRTMRSTAYLVNTSRGPIIDQEALVHAVQNGWIAGAALDVFDEEPLPPEHPLRRTPGILATGHVGYVTTGNYSRYFGDAVEDIDAYLAGNPIRVIN